MKRLAIFLFACLLLPAATACSKKGPVHPFVVPEGGQIRIPIDLVNDGNAHFYTYRFGEKNINFFARTDVEGKILTHFDACYTCFKYREGYVQQGRQVVCTACQIGFELDVAEWDWVGPCVPVTLKSRVKDGFLVIAADKLEKGARLF